MLILLFIIISSINIFSQSKSLRTGVYLAAPKDSCTGKNNEVMVYSSDTLCLKKIPIISVKDIDSCISETSKLDGKEMYVLNIKLKEAAKLEFKKITENNIGKKIVMLIDKKIVMAGVIRDPVTSGMLTISGASKKEIKTWEKELKKEINN